MDTGVDSGLSGALQLATCKLRSTCNLQVAMQTRVVTYVRNAKSYSVPRISRMLTLQATALNDKQRSVVYAVD